jgi:hypothetical protein
MSLAAMVAGAPFFLADGEGDGDGVTLGVSSASGVVVGLEGGAGDSGGVGDGDGEDFRFFFGEALGEGAGVGEDFLFFFGEADALGSGVSPGAGLGDVFFFEDEGDGDRSGVADGFGVGNFFASSFFFGVGEILRCFRGGGVGVGAKIFLILLPNDSSACAGAAKFVNIVRPARAANPMANARRLAVIPSAVEP